MRKVSLALLIVFISTPLLAQADSSEEQQAVKVLQSDAALPEKEAACLQLKRTGTAKAVPPLPTPKSENLRS